MDPSSAPTTRFLTRRRILGWGGAGTIGGIAGYLGWPRHESAAITGSNPSTPKAPAANPEPQPSAPRAVVGGIRREDFLPHLKSAFQLDSGTSCTLVEVSAAQETASATASYSSFSLLFAAPADSAADSRIHQLTHPQMGTLDLFISPVGHAKKHVYLEAVCSQRV